MKPWIHAQSSAKKFGGEPEDYLEIHDFMDSSKAHVADVRHRIIFHSSFGIYITEMVFGTIIKNSEDKDISVRDIAEQHVMEDLGFIPSLDHWIKNVDIEEWMCGNSFKNTKNKEATESEDKINLPSPNILPPIPWDYVPNTWPYRPKYPFVQPWMDDIIVKD